MGLYKTADGIDYKALKSAIGKERIPATAAQPKPFEGLGYLDFDTMEEKKSLELPATEFYIAIVDQKQYGELTIIKQKKAA